MTYLLIFISSIVLIAILSSFYKHITSERDFTSEYISTVDCGRTLDLETETSEIQHKPV